MAYNKLFDFASIGHFFFHYIIGLRVKNNYLFSFLVGIVWEIFEYFITKYHFTRKLIIKYYIVPKENWDEDMFNRNRVSDLIFNMLGYHFGNIQK